MQFEVLHRSTKSRARIGRIHTPHGIIDTPGFVAVGTNGTIKALDSAMVSEIGLQLMFCNTYHLMLQPGTDVVKQAGGLHKFMGRNMPIITDSGGFQVFSLAYGGVTSELKGNGKKRGTESGVLKITEEGVLFRSYRDGKKVLLTPETSVQAQKDLGADIIIPFDELPPYHIDKKALENSLERTHRWEKRSLDTHRKNPNAQAMYAVIHGGVDRVMRKKSCEVLTKEPFDGYAIGGSVGKTKEEMIDMLRYTMPMLPEDKPNHLLGIGDIPSLTQCIPLGIDTFDSSYPTKAARHGVLFSEEGPIHITQGKYKHCHDTLSGGYSYAYLHHLFKAREITGMTLATIHNLRYMVTLMETFRAQIAANAI